MNTENVKKEFRQQAIDWLNSKRDLDKGISLLEEAGYKPDVMKNFRKNMTRRDIPRKVETEVRLYIRYCTNPGKVDIDENKLPEDDTDLREETFAGTLEKELQNEYPPEVKNLLTEFSDLYKARSMYHKDMKAVGEKNDAESKSERKRIGAMIGASSHRMNELYKHWEAYKADGTLPPEDLFKEPFDPEKKTETKPAETTVTLPDSPEELKKLKENLRVKIARSENQLLYQSNKKEEKENPMPAGPKREKTEKNLEEMKATQKAVELKLVELK